MTDLKQRRLRLILLLLALVAALSASQVLSEVWFLVSAQDAAVPISGNSAWPGLAQVCWLQAALLLLACYLKRVGSLITTTIAFASIGLVLAFGATTFREPPDTLLTEFAKVTGLMSDLTSVIDTDASFVFLAFQSVALALTVVAFIIRIRIRGESSATKRFERPDDGDSDPISIWDSQR